MQSGMTDFRFIHKGLFKNRLFIKDLILNLSGKMFEQLIHVNIGLSTDLKEIERMLLSEFIAILIRDLSLLIIYITFGAYYNYNCIICDMLFNLF